jgi:acetate---CoA ligase (ADP-forming)
VYSFAGEVITRRLIRVRAEVLRPSTAVHDGGSANPPVAFADISRLVRPHRVAVVGASDRPGSLGYSTYHNVRDNSVIAGGAVPVNPGYETVLSDRCYPRVSDVPGDPIDVAIVLVTAERVPAVVKDCAASGVRYLVVLSSGFSETGEAGRGL